MPATAHHFVFVDFENVQPASIELPPGAPVQVVLLLGEKQRKLELGLVQQIHRQAAHVQLIEVGAAGRNALDLTLAYHLGRTVAAAPKDARFHIVSRDKDFDPLIAHLRGEGRHVFRHDEFSALPFLGARPKPPKPDESLGKLVELLSNAKVQRPARQKSLRSFINTCAGEKLSAPEIDAALQSLVARGIVTIDAAGKVAYPA